MLGHDGTNRRTGGKEKFHHVYFSSIGIVADCVSLLVDKGKRGNFFKGQQLFVLSALFVFVDHPNPKNKNDKGNSDIGVVFHLIQFGFFDCKFGLVKEDFQIFAQFIF